jgi:hypothetical protein
MGESMSTEIHNDVFGHLTWDDHLGCWLGGIEWPADRYTEVAIWHPGYDVAAGLRMATDGLDWLKSFEEHARRSVAREILDIHNDSRDEEDWLSEEQLIRRIKLVRVGFIEDGSLLLTYDAGDLFDGNLIDGDFGPDRSLRGTYLVD